LIVQAHAELSLIHFLSDLLHGCTALSKQGIQIQCCWQTYKNFRYFPKFRL